MAVPFLVRMLLATAVVFLTLGEVEAKDCGDTAGGGGSDVPCDCGDTVVTSTKINPNVDKVDDFPCPGVGLRILGSFIDLDLNGQKISGFSNNPDDSGIRIEGSHVIVRNGKVKGFVHGIDVASGTEGVTIVGVKAQKNRDNGMFIGGSQHTIMNSKAKKNGNAGFRIGRDVIGSGRESSDGNVIVGNVATDNGDDGLNARGCDGFFQSNQATGNVGHGIQISKPGGVGDADHPQCNTDGGGNVGEGNGVNDCRMSGFKCQKFLQTLLHEHAEPKVCGDSAGPGNSNVPCDCGDDVVTNTTLVAGQDPIVTDKRKCAGLGLDVTSSGVKLDMNGLKIRGFGDGSTTGVRISGNDVTVEKGKIQKFEDGVGVHAMPGTAGAEIREIVSKKNGTGILMEGGEGIIEDNDLRQNGNQGIRARLGANQPSNLNEIVGNLAELNGEDGILVRGCDNFIGDNEVNSNGDEGILVSADPGTNCNRDGARDGQPNSWAGNCTKNPNDCKHGGCSIDNDPCL